MTSVWFNDYVEIGPGAGTENTTESTTETGRGVTTTRSPSVAIDRDLALDEYSAPTHPAQVEVPPFDDDDAFAEEEHTEIPTTDDDDVDLEEAGERRDAHSRARRVADFRVWSGPDSLGRVMVRPPSLNALQSDDSRDRVTKRWHLMQQYGLALLRYGGLTSEALTAESFEAFYDALEPKTGRYFAAKAGHKDGSQLARDVKRLVVELPVGRVSLDFLFLNIPSSRAPQGRTVHEIARELMRRPELMWRTTTEIKSAILGAGDTVRHIVPWCRAAETWKAEVVSEAIQYRSNPLDAGGLVNRLAATLRARHSELSDEQRERFGDLPPEFNDKGKKQNRHGPALARALVIALDGLS